MRAPEPSRRARHHCNPFLTGYHTKPTIVWKPSHPMASNAPTAAMPAPGPMYANATASAFVADPATSPRLDAPAAMTAKQIPRRPPRPPARTRALERPSTLRSLVAIMVVLPSSWISFRTCSSLVAGRNRFPGGQDEATDDAIPQPGPANPRRRFGSCPGIESAAETGAQLRPSCQDRRNPPRRLSCGTRAANPRTENHS